MFARLYGGHLPLLVSVFLFLLVIDVSSLPSASHCLVQTPLPIDPGPAYKPNPPFKTEFVCDPSDSRVLSHVENCNGFCWSRVFSKVSVSDSIRMRVRGNVVADSSECPVIPNAEVDIWQTTSQGRYASIVQGEDDTLCRGVLKTDADGSFYFETDIPGTYGLTALSGPKWFPDLPPYGPQHLHVMVWAPGYDMVSTQLYISKDEARYHDWRDLAPNMDHHAKDLRNILQLSFDEVENVWISSNITFVLTRNSSQTSFNRTEVIEEKYCTGLDFNVPLLLCHPDKAWLLSPFLHVSLGLILISGWLILAFWLVRWVLYSLCCCGSGESADDGGGTRSRGTKVKTG